MKHSVDPNLFCSNAKCDELITLTAVDFPHVDTMIAEARHSGWKFRLNDGTGHTLHELALLHTLRPCKDCGGEVLYAHNYTVACCSCFGEPDDCEECQNGGCQNAAINMNLPDAITRWNLYYGDSTKPRGQVEVIH